MPYINSLKDGFFDEVGVMSATPDSSHGIRINNAVILRNLSSACVCSAVTIGSAANPYAPGNYIKGTFCVLEGQKAYLKVASQVIPITGIRGATRQTLTGTSATTLPGA